jgi:hypothetical protein
METFEYKKCFYIVVQDEYEPRESFMERVWYIIKHFNEDKVEIKSRMIENERIFKCKYNK